VYSLVERDLKISRVVAGRGEYGKEDEESRHSWKIWHSLWSFVAKGCKKNGGLTTLKIFL